MKFFSPSSRPCRDPYLRPNPLCLQKHIQTCRHKFLNTSSSHKKSPSPVNSTACYPISNMKAKQMPRSKQKIRNKLPCYRNSQGFSVWCRDPLYDVEKQIRDNEKCCNSAIKSRLASGYHLYTSWQTQKRLGEHEDVMRRRKTTNWPVFRQPPNLELRSCYCVFGAASPLTVFAWRAAESVQEGVTSALAVVTERNFESWWPFSEDFTHCATKSFCSESRAIGKIQRVELLPSSWRPPHCSWSLHGYRRKRMLFNTIMLQTW